MLDIPIKGVIIELVVEPIRPKKKEVTGDLR
jgi:hypothetical protein